MGGNQTFFEKIKRFLEPAVDNKYSVLRLVIHFLVDAMIGVVFIFFIRSIIEVIENGNIDTFYHTLIFFATAFILIQGTHFVIRQWGWTDLIQLSMVSIEKKYMNQYLRMDNNAHEAIGVGKTISIMSKGIWSWVFLLDNSISKITVLVVSIGVSFYFISQVNTVLGYGLFILIIIGQIIGMYLNKWLVQERKKRIEYANLGGKQMVKILMSKMEILQSDKAEREITIQGGFHHKAIICNKNMAWPLVLMGSIGNIITFIILFATFLYFGHLYFWGNVSLGLLASTGGAIILMQRILGDSLLFLKDFTKEFAQVQNMWDFFDTTPEIQGYDTGSKFTHKTGSITLNNINYGYDRNNPVFQNFSLTLPGSQVTALVGPSGGGKSTLVKLIAGYIRADSGEVIIDDQKLSEVSLKSYYKDIGYLTQEPSVFDGTILENLTYALETHPQPLPSKEGGKSENSSPLSGGRCPEDGGGLDERLHHIIKLAKCEFVYDFPNGLDTEIGEKGIRLSGGQRQRLAIAKIFLKDPKIIILDEPTSALDSFSEEQITEAMHNLFKGRTVIIIAHRLQTVKSADDIILLENGAIKERGTHSELVKQKRMYKKMLDLQSGF